MEERIKEFVEYFDALLKDKKEKVDLGRFFDILLIKKENLEKIKTFLKEIDEPFYIIFDLLLQLYESEVLDKIRIMELWLKKLKNFDFEVYEDVYEDLDTYIWCDYQQILRNAFNVRYQNKFLKVYNNFKKKFGFKFEKIDDELFADLSREKLEKELKEKLKEIIK